MDYDESTAITLLEHLRLEQSIAEAHPNINALQINPKAFINYYGSLTERLDDKINVHGAATIKDIRNYKTYLWVMREYLELWDL